jgi:hypothetical protein
MKITARCAAHSDGERRKLQGQDRSETGASISYCSHNVDRKVSVFLMSTIRSFFVWIDRDSAIVLLCGV